jgi:hypothetical protein
MTSLQEAKSVVSNHYKTLDSAQSTDELKLCFEKNTAVDYLWRGFHPFGEIIDRNLVVFNFWKPFRNSFRCTQRRQDIFFAGKNSLKNEEGIWVVSMGHLLSLFDREWLGIQPNFKIVMLRYCEFNLVHDGKILQTAFYFDIPHLMSQANQNPFGPQTGSSIVQPGPRTQDGMLFEDANSEASETTLQLINRMISDLGQWENPLPLEEELELSWQDDMLWWGPHGIGSTFTIERYAKQHAGPFRAAFSNRSSTGHVARVAEGHYGGFFGWPNFTAQHDGGFMGLPKSSKNIDFKVIDIYRRGENKLAENWVFIDILSIFYQQDVDLLDRNRMIQKG